MKLYLKSFFVICILTLSSELALGRGIEFIIENEELFLTSKNGKVPFSFNEYKKHKENPHVHEAFRKKYNISLINFLKSKKVTDDDDSSLLNFIQLIDSFDQKDFFPGQELENMCSTLRSSGDVNIKRLHNSGGIVMPDLRTKLVGICRKQVKKYTRDHNSLKKPEFDKEVSRLKAEVKTIIDEYKGQVRKDEGLLKYTVDVPYEDINGTEKIKSHTCNLTYPDNNSLEVYKKLRTDGGNKFDLSSIDNTSLNATLISHAEVETKCLGKREFNKDLKDLLTRSTEEAKFISIIKKDVYCRIYSNKQITKEVVESAKKKLEQIGVGDSFAKKSLQRYLDRIEIVSGNISVSDNYENEIWKQMFDELENNCGQEGLVDRSAAEISASLNSSFKNSYISDCEKGSLSEVAFRCKVMAVNYGLEMSKKLKSANEELNVAIANQRNWNRNTQICPEKRIDKDCSSRNPMFKEKSLKSCLYRNLK